MNARPIDRVLEAVFRQIPDDFKYRDSIRRNFDDIIESVRYTAPEAIYLRWGEAAQTLLDYIPAPDFPWQETVRKIFNGELNYLDFLERNDYVVVG